MILVLVKRKHGHDDARRAISALASSGFDHGLLHRVQFAFLRLEVFDSYKLLSVDHREKHKAGVHRFVMHLSLRVAFSDHHCARAAVALCATLFDAFVGRQTAQVVENRGRGCWSSRIGKIERCQNTIENKGYLRNGRTQNGSMDKWIGG